MPVPDLDWRSDLFDDAAAVADDPIVNHTAPGLPDGALWPTMRRVWAADMAGPGGSGMRPSLSIMRISAMRNVINAQRS